MTNVPVFRIIMRKISQNDVMICVCMMSQYCNRLTHHKQQWWSNELVGVFWVWSHFLCVLTHWGRVTHICVGDLTIIGSDNGLSPGRHQAIIWTNAGILLIGPLGTNFSEILIEILTFSFKKMHLKMSSAKWQTFCLGLNVLNQSRLCKK